MRLRLGLLLLPLLLAGWFAGAGPASADGHPGAAGTVSVATTTATTLQRSGSTDDSTSWSTSVPSFQHPTDKTNNEPLLIIGAVLLAVLVIGGIAALIRLRARGDDADLN